jgi:hypothetical protein
MSASGLTTGAGKHTPGPWKIVPRETLEDGSVYPAHITGGARDLEICLLETDYAAANFEPCDAMHESVGDVRSKAANFRLITAAPELLAALQGFLSIAGESAGVYGYHLNGEPADWDEFPEVFAAFAAIAKATGAE